MSPAEYRAMLTDALAKPGNGNAHVLTLTGNTRGMGARGELLAEGPNGPVRSFTKADVRKMLKRLDEAEAEQARAQAIPGASRLPNGDWTIGCEPCGVSIVAQDTEFGRALVRVWPNVHARTCTAPAGKP